MVTESLGWCLELSLNRRVKFYIGRPIYYTGGLVLSLATLTVGGSLVFCDSLDDNRFQDAWAGFLFMCERHALDWAFFIPDQLRAFMVRAKEEMRFGPFPARILTMGAPISGAEKVAVSRAFQCGVIESWGNSESLGTITDEEDLSQRPDSIGRPFLTDELFIVDDEGNKLGPDQIGRIAGHVEAGFTAYSSQPEATNSTIVRDMIISDDIGKMDPSGHFYILGRVSDVLNVDGRPVTVSMIESLIRSRHADLAFGVVILKRDEQSRPEIGLITEAVTPEVIADIRTLVAGEHASIRLRHLQVHGVPRLATGKFDRIGAAGMFSRAP
jgi:acyl-coenzyme A synthetase/AMP-(fatty) acid ligase